MTLPRPERFVRLPTELLESLIRRRFSGTQWRVLLWVVRHTYGWNRTTTLFSWYRIASDLGSNRPGVARAGKRLLTEGVLSAEGDQIGMAMGDSSHPLAKAVDVKRHPNGCRAAPIFRRAKDSSKDNSKTSKKIQQERTWWHPAGAPRPIVGKYDGISQD
jgi:phage replication O-like protein O